MSHTKEIQKKYPHPQKPLDTETPLLCGFNKSPSLHTEHPFTSTILEYTRVCEQLGVYWSISAWGCTRSDSCLTVQTCSTTPECSDGCSSHVPQVLLHINSKVLTPANSHKTTHYVFLRQLYQVSHDAA